MAFGFALLFTTATLIGCQPAEETTTPDSGDQETTNDGTTDEDTSAEADTADSGEPPTIGAPGNATTDDSGDTPPSIGVTDEEENTSEGNDTSSWMPTDGNLLLAFATAAHPAMVTMVDLPEGVESKLPPVEDLEAQLEEYVEELEDDLDDLQGIPDFEAGVESLYMDANTLALIALAIGKAEADSKYKKATPEIIEAAQKAAKAEDLDAAKEAVEAVKAALETSGNPDALEWVKVASLKEVMEHVPAINTGMKRYMKSDRYLSRGIDKIKGGTAVIAAISQGTIPNADETIKPDAVDKWVEYSIISRDAALKVNELAHKYENDEVDFDTIDAAYAEMEETCHTCHEVFNPGSDLD
jgi:cytochrome c556